MSLTALITLIYQYYFPRKFNVFKLAITKRKPSNHRKIRETTTKQHSTSKCFIIFHCYGESFL